MRWSNDSTQSNFSNKQSKYCSLSQSKEFIVFPANIRLSEETLKMSGRGLLSSSSEDVFKTSSRRLDQDEYIFYRAGKEMSIGINPYSQKSGTNLLKLTNIRLADRLYFVGHGSIIYITASWEDQINLGISVGFRRYAPKSKS